MNLRKLLLAGFLTVGIIAGYAGHATADTVSGTANAEIRAAIALTETTEMDFGIIEPVAGGDTITLTPAGGISASGASTLAGTAAAGVWDATGTASHAVGISFSSGDTLTGPGTAMPLGSFTHNAGGSPAFDGSGDLSFNVGAALTINASQASGDYSGSYSVTVDYP